MTASEKHIFTDEEATLKVTVDMDSHSPCRAADPWQQLAALESEIMNVDVLPRELVLKLIHLKRNINACSSPVLQLPPEITSEIFFAYISDNVRDAVDTWQLQFRSPLIFGTVCSSWRELAWSTPGLWSSLKLDLTMKADSTLVDQWLLRSGTTTLLSMHASFYEPYNIPNPHVMAIMDVIARYSERWSHIAFELPQFCYERLVSRVYHEPSSQS
jgi:hypothetical protein